MPGLNLIASFLQQATAQGTRSTVLNPLGWFFGMCTAGLLGAVHYNSPHAVLMLLGCLTGGSGVTYLSAFVYCLTTKREHLLRTEKFVLQQLAIEKGFRGDSTTGIIALEKSIPVVEQRAVDQMGADAE